MREGGGNRSDGGSRHLPPWLEGGSQHLLDAYLAVIGADYDDGAVPRLKRGQFHDVVLLGDVAYRFPRDEESRRLLPARIELLRLLGKYELPVTIPRLLSAAAVGDPLGRCHVALQRVPGQPIGPEHVASAPAESAVIAGLAMFLDDLLELGTDAAIRQAVPQDDSDQWQRFAARVHQILFPLMSQDGRALAEAELTRVLAVEPIGEALVHGDLGGTNLLWTTFDSEPQLAGVLDWTEHASATRPTTLHRSPLPSAGHWPLRSTLGSTAARHPLSPTPQLSRPLSLSNRPSRLLSAETPLPWTMA